MNYVHVFDDYYVSADDNAVTLYKKGNSKNKEAMVTKGWYTSMEQAVTVGFIQKLEAELISSGNYTEAREIVSVLNSVKDKIAEELLKPVPFADGAIQVPTLENKLEKAEIKIIYHSDEIEKLRYIDGKSDWIDLRAAKDYHLHMFEFALIDLGISVQLPKGYEMLIAPRSSTYKNFGVIQTNSIGVVDESYCGKDDVLKMPVVALRETDIHVNDRICQFRIVRHQPEITFSEDFNMEAKNRGGIGSTGKA